MIILITVDGEKALLTADAGIPALTEAADYAEAHGVLLTDLRFMQLPHHGSSHNVGPAVLEPNHGKISLRLGWGKGSEAPCEESYDAVHRRNGIPCVTAGKILRHSICAPGPQRLGFEPTPIPFYDRVEAA